MFDLLTKAGIYPTGRFDPWSRCVDKVAGLEPVSTHQWRLTAGKTRADVRIDPGGNLRIAGRVPVPPSARSALETSHDLPGNLRYATRGRHAFLVADTHLDGATHLARSFTEIKAGLRFALGDGSAPISAEPLTPETLSEVLSAGAWPEESIVERGAGWELRPRLHGEATPVQAVVDGGSLRIYQTVVRDLAKPWGVAPACFEALRFNDRLRLARLVWIDGAIAAETRLHRGQLSPSWLETAARAVAVAGRHTKLVLGVLAENREVAELYAGILLPEGGTGANEQ
jgi:hypothetical protein